MPVSHGTCRKRAGRCCRRLEQPTKIATHGTPGIDGRDARLTEELLDLGDVVLVAVAKPDRLAQLYDDIFQRPPELNVPIARGEGSLVTAEDVVILAQVVPVIGEESLRLCVFLAALALSQDGAGVLKASHGKGHDPVRGVGSEHLGRQLARVDAEDDGALGGLGRERAGGHAADEPGRVSPREISNGRAEEQKAVRSSALLGLALDPFEPVLERAL